VIFKNLQISAFKGLKMGRTFYFDIRIRTLVYYQYDYCHSPGYPAALSQSAFESFGRPF
jgi:hypothetical protein